MFMQITVQRYVVFVSTVELRTLYIQELLYINTFCECILKKSDLRNVVKVCFSMRYSSRKLSNDKVITTACNF